MADTPQEIIARVKQRNYEARTQYEPDILWLIEQAEKATATPPADAALADELWQWAGDADVSDRKAFMACIEKCCAALRARAVPEAVAKYRHHLALLRDDCTYTAGHVGSVVLNGHRMEIIRDALSAMLAASKGQKP